MAAIIDGVEGIFGHYGVARQDGAFYECEYKF
jgi:hypothetical protein